MESFKIFKPIENQYFMTCKQIIDTLCLAIDSPLANDVVLIERELPRGLREIEEHIHRRNFSDAFKAITGMAGEIKAMGNRSFTY
jgi:hypothetical protein